jgi:hypothetical protein
MWRGQCRCGGPHGGKIASPLYTRGSYDRGAALPIPPSVTCRTGPTSARPSRCGPAVLPE